MLLRLLPLLVRDTVSHAPHGLNQIRRLPELFPEAEYVRINCTLHHAHVSALYFLDQMVAGKHAALVLCKGHEQLELVWSEGDELTAETGLVRGFVNFEGSQGEQRVFLAGQPAQERPGAGMSTESSNGFTR